MTRRVLARAAALTGSPESVAALAARRLRGCVDALWLTDRAPPAGLDLPVLREAPDAVRAPAIEALAAGDARVLADAVRSWLGAPTGPVYVDGAEAAALLAGPGGRAAERRWAALAGLLLSLPGPTALPLGLLAGGFGANDVVDADAWAGLHPEEAGLRERMADAAGRLLSAQAAHPAFGGLTTWRAPDAGPSVFCLIRDAASASDGPVSIQRSRLVCLVNVTPAEQLVSLDWRALLGTRNAIRDLVTGVRFNVHGPSLGLAPYQTAWTAV